MDVVFSEVYKEDVNKEYPVTVSHSGRQSRVLEFSCSKR